MEAGSLGPWLKHGAKSLQVGGLAEGEWRSSSEGKGHSNHQKGQHAK